jgi:hypothetical protein
MGHGGSLAASARGCLNGLGAGRRHRQDGQRNESSWPHCRRFRHFDWNGFFAGTSRQASCDHHKPAIFGRAAVHRARHQPDAAARARRHAPADRFRSCQPSPPSVLGLPGLRKKAGSDPAHRLVRGTKRRPVIQSRLVRLGLETPRPANSHVLMNKTAAELHQPKNFHSKTKSSLPTVSSLGFA